MDRMATTAMSIQEVGALSSRVLDEVERAIIGKRDALEQILLGILGDGHVLLEDYPGLAKTLIARSFAQTTSLEFLTLTVMFSFCPARNFKGASGPVICALNPLSGNGPGVFETTL